MDSYIYYDQSLEYPSLGEDIFSPSQYYPEYPWSEKAQHPNKIYEAIRNLFYSYGLDKDNFGKPSWNPLKKIINPGMKVLIKPNMVLHQTNNNYDVLITHPSIVRAVADYVCIALQGSGEIIIADSPIQSCNFYKLINETGYQKLKNYYTKKHINLSLLDLRQTCASINEEKEIESEELSLDPLGYQLVNLYSSSFHADQNINPSLFRVTNYAPSTMHKYHNKNSHAYLISRTVLSADAVISIPKLKTHRKAGMTGAIKNCVGIVGDKACLPHHKSGPLSEGGDEYLYKSMTKRINTLCNEVSDILNKKNFIFFVKYIRKFQHLNNILIKLYKKDNYFEGSWYGNDTISRTSLDLLRILTFSSKSGDIKASPQRNLLFLVDGIIAGEGEGPLLASPRQTGILGISDNAIILDSILTTLMGFDIKKIPTLVHALKHIGQKIDNIKITTNNSYWNNKYLSEISYQESLKFTPTSGWDGHILISK